MKRLAPIFAIFVLICVLALLSRIINPNGEEKPTPPVPSASAAPLPTTDPIPAETSIGNPATAKYHILVGWVYNETYQQDPASLQTALSEILKFAQSRSADVALEIVNLDVPAEDLSPAAQQVTQVGVTVDGKPVVNINSRTGHDIPENIGTPFRVMMPKS